jgi:hypothetical protein
MDARDYAEPALFGPEEPICPYTGLRTFTEDEAIYFRGREEHVAKCLTLLGAERFVMITGASGDGKSSLVFAGLLPEVRAGFLRGRYSSWAVATFRPERSPLRNMARALAPALRLESSTVAIETELEQGFSALVQLYQASVLCPPDELPAGLTVAEQRQHKRQAANLLVVVDQFEEFFTNSENYAGQGPSTAAQTVVNLLLETTRLAQAQNLPIYIVCTMRSDFVGQCAEFRGLIEQIGTSQYFVPRLLRHEFVEVIKEPALLSGNRISERLVQRLLYDIHFGQDQLPVLQHALRRIWLAADQGREEMDLIHYAMVGGLADELPVDDQARFAEWRAGLSATQQQFLLAQPSLRNVLDAHANQLYYDATSLYNADFQPPLPPGTAENVIERTFRVLTRTDGQRVVRNRLSGAEITAILGDPALPWPVVCHILRPFRQAGTTFLSPFLLEEADNRDVLPPDAVLDITHESLIRNWKHLSEWASSEAEDVRIAQDLMQQASRWEANAESRGFLLPIGSYSYFAQWNKRKQVNASWLAHYVAADGTPEAPRQAQATTQHGVLRRFLETSRRRLYMPLLIARYGVGRLAAAVLLPVLLVGLGWWAWAQRQQQADYVAYSVIEERLPYLKSPSVAVEDKAHLLINADRLKSFIYKPWFGEDNTAAYIFEHQLDELHNDTLALSIELGIYQQINNEQYDNAEREHPWTQRVLLDLNQRLTRADSLAGLRGGSVWPSAQQRQLAVHTARISMALAHYLTYARLRGPLDGTAQRLARRKQTLLRHLRDYAAREVATTAGPPPGPVEFGYCLRVLLGQGDFRPDELAFLDGLNPLVPGSAAQRQFKRFFPPDRVFYAHGGSLQHSGGYLTSAIIFAARRQIPQLSQCLDVLNEQTSSLDDANGGLAVLPYLVKYKGLTPDNLTTLLQECSEVGEGFPFGEMYAATVYSLLSVSPSDDVYAVGMDGQPAAEENACRTGSINPDLLDVDRVSFALPTAVRDTTWAVLLATPQRVGSEKPLFASSDGPDRSARNIPFLQAFLAKMHGTYEAELLHDASAAAESFATFSQALAELKRHGGRNAALNLLKWNLGTAQVVEITQAGSVNQDPLSYLQQPTRPKTIFLQAYYTCSFDAFFRYQLQREATQPVPNYKLVQLLDSVAFVEVAFPDRHANTRQVSLRTSSMERQRRNKPNLVWIKAIAETPVGSDVARQRRNTLLYKVSATLQDSARLRQFQQFQLSAAEQRLAYQLTRQPGFAQVPLQLAFSDLATALAHVRRWPEAWTLARMLPTPLTTITALRMSEQAMLLSDHSQSARLDSFLLAYLNQGVEQPLKLANSGLPLLYWQFEKTGRWEAGKTTATKSLTQYGSGLDGIAAYLIREGRPATQAAGPVAMCRGRSLADDSYQAVRAIPVYQAERLRQSCFTAVLASLAHRKNQPGDGWREYDEKVLTTVANYDGPAQ